MKSTTIRPSHPNNDQISFLWKPGEKLVELVHTEDGLKFAIRDGLGVRYELVVDSYSPISWVAEYINVGAIRLPSAAEANVHLDDLANRIRGFIHRYFDCSSQFESVAVLYVLHTWMYEQFQAVPYLRFLGIPGSGKTRGTEVIGALCYRPLVIAGSSTPAPMFRMIEAIGGTMLIDEADYQQSGIGSEIIKVLNCGYQRNLPVTRMEKDSSGNFVPRVYAVFGPKIINGRRPFRDEATESRCLGFTPHVVRRVDIPTQLPPEFSVQAAAIQNMALGWRMENIDKFAVRQTGVPGLRGRASQIAIPLLSVANAMSPYQCMRYRADLLEFCKNLEQQAAADRRESVEGNLLAAYVSWPGNNAPTCKNLVQAVLDEDKGNDPSLQRWLTPKRASNILRNMGFETHHTNRGSEVTIDPNRLQPLRQRFGIETDAPVTEPVLKSA
jgi:hypothetical protein